MCIRDSTTCHLEYHPDYIPSHSTSSTCLLGAWSSSSTCVSALALIRGRNSLAPYNTVEIYGAGMHRKLPDLPDAMTGCTVPPPPTSHSNQWVPHSSTTGGHTTEVLANLDTAMYFYVADKDHLSW